VLKSQESCIWEVNLKYYGHTRVDDGKYSSVNWKH
jgi:hypothetical protein